MFAFAFDQKTKDLLVQGLALWVGGYLATEEIHMQEAFEGFMVEVQLQVLYCILNDVKMPMFDGNSESLSNMPKHKFLVIALPQQSLEILQVTALSVVDHGLAHANEAEKEVHVGLL